MGLRVNGAAQRRLNAIQSQLLATRLAAGMSRASLGDLLSISSRTLRDWEKCYSSPGLANALNWARTLGFRLVVTDRLTGPQPIAAAPDGDGALWEVQEMRRLAPPLKARRLARKISQTDLGLICGVTRSSLQRWEDAERLPRLVALIVWADRLDFIVELRPLDES
jgi:transcriptional regulator with XRE-family HTH domain